MITDERMSVLVKYSSCSLHQYLWCGMMEFGYDTNPGNERPV